MSVIQLCPFVVGGQNNGRLFLHVLYPGKTQREGSVSINRVDALAQKWRTGTVYTGENGGHSCENLNASVNLNTSIIRFGYLIYGMHHHPMLLPLSRSNEWIHLA